MIINLSSDLFQNKDNLHGLSQLLGIFSDRRRYDYFCELPNILKTEVFQNLLKIDQDLISEYFERFMMMPSFNLTYSVSTNSSNTEFNVLEAKRFFSQPVIIILENSLNDGWFLDTIFSLFRKKARKIKRHKDNGWLKYGNGGGCTNIPNFIEGELKSYTLLPKPNKEYLRCFVLVDSDRKFPSTTSIPDKANLISYLEGNAIPYHQLEKREIENYMPDDILQSIPNNEEYIEAYLSLNPLQKDFFDLEKGFNDKNLASFETEIQELYSDVKNETFSIFRKQTINYDNYKTEFPKLFTKATKDGLQERIKHHPDEFELLLNTITNLL